MLPQLLRVTVDLMLLRRGPQELPSDWGLLGGLGFVYCSLAFTQVRLVADTGSAFAQALLATGMLALFAHAVLRWRGEPGRFVQTLTALFAVGVVLTLLMLGPTTALVPFLESLAQAQDPESVAQPPIPVLLAYIVIGIWGLVVFGHIYRHALGVNLWLGVATALGFELLLFFTLSLLGTGR
jgi:drug/metabolite transporter (DMT)-like permease